MTPSPWFMRLFTLMLLAIGLAHGPALAQPVLFGSLDDPAETHRVARWDRERNFDLMGGFSLIGAQWRTAAATRLHVEGGRGSLLLDGSIRAGIYGGYEPDYDEPYDLLRVVRHVRLDPVDGRFSYLRVGTVTRGRLGVGHLVNFFSGATAWDERRVGLELRFGSESLAGYAMADDLRMGDVVGVRSTWNPLAASPSPVLRSVQLGGSYVADRATLGLPDAAFLAAWEADVRLEAVRSGAFALRPFASFARFTNYGQGFLLGADLEADNFIDIARLHMRLAIHYAGDQFEPGYFGAFYPVHNPRSRIVTDDVPDGFVVGVPLEQIRGATSVFTELRVHIFERFEFWYAFRRQYGGQSLSTMHLRLYLRTRRFRLGIGQDRGGLDGFFSLFRPLESESILYFRADYRVVRGLWVHTEARYTYERIDRDASDTRFFLVQRRFEPFVGLRIPF